MNESSRNPVLERLQELEGWAQYTTEALHLDQANEQVKQANLERALEGGSLREIQELSWRLRDQLHLLSTQLELSLEESGRKSNLAPAQARGWCQGPSL